jgi:hypothetical protein
MVGKVMHLAGKFTAIFKKIWKYYHTIDGPAHGLSSGKEFSIPNMQNSFILRKIQTSVFNGHSLGGKRVCITNRFIKVMP